MLYLGVPQGDVFAIYCNICFPGVFKQMGSTEQVHVK